MPSRAPIAWTDRGNPSERLPLRQEQEPKRWRAWRLALGTGSRSVSVEWCRAPLPAGAGRLGRKWRSGEFDPEEKGNEIASCCSSGLCAAMRADRIVPTRGVGRCGHISPYRKRWLALMRPRPCESVLPRVLLQPKWRIGLNLLIARYFLATETPRKYEASGLTLPRRGARIKGFARLGAATMPFLALFDCPGSLPACERPPNPKRGNRNHHARHRDRWNTMGR